MKQVLLAAAGIFHPPFTARLALRQALAEMVGYQFKHIRSLEKLPADMEKYAAVVIYVHHKRLSDPALKKLETFIASGRGLLGVHSATASYKDSPGYFNILGGRFVGHGPTAAFTAVPVENAGLFSEIPPFTVFDELYLHEYHAQVDVHFTAQHEGKDVPVVWTAKYGQGRVCYAVPGHTTATLKNKTYQKLLQRALQWVCGHG